jgi:hypothetical protein
MKAKHPMEAKEEVLLAAESRPLLEAILDGHQPVSRPIDGLVIGRLAGITPAGDPEVTLNLPGFPERLTARSLCPVSPERIDTPCAVMFEQGNPERPIIMGFLHQPEATVAIQVDGIKHLIEAEKEIVLKCGKASITLRADGRVEVRGATVITHATGLNRIRGASVKLN